MKKVLLITACIMMPALRLLHAQEQPKDTISLEEVVVTGSKTPQSRGNVTQQIDIIDQKEISTIISGNRNIAEALRYTPGASVSALSRNDANWGTYGGIGPKYSTYMLNGLPLDAFVDPMSLDLNAIGRIEVQRGPASVLYPNYLSQDFAGNQSPHAGTVNLILKDRVEKNQTMAALSYGSYNTLNGQFFTQQRSGHLHYFLGTTYEMSDYTNYGTNPSWLNMQKDPAYKKTKIYGGATWYMGKDEKQKMSLFFNKTLHTGDAGRVYRGFNNDYTTIQAAYTNTISDRLTLQAHMGVRNYNRTWQESNFGVVDTLKSNNGVVQNIIPADISLAFRHGENHMLTVGADYQGAEYYNFADPLKGYNQYGNKSRALQSGLYAQEELRFGGLTIRGGLRYSYVKNNIELIDGSAPGDKSKTYTNMLWSGGAKYKISKDIAVFVNAGNSFISPGLKSIGGTIPLSKRDSVGYNGQLPNPSLKPEYGTGFDGGVDVRLPLGLNVNVRGFMLQVNDAIIENVVSQNPSQSQSINAGKTSSTGGEIDIRQYLNKSFRWFANATYMKTKISNPNDADQNGANVPFAPSFISNVGLTYVSPFGTYVSPYVNYNGGYYDGSSLTGRKFFKPGALVNIQVIQQLAKGDDYKVDLFGNFYNITNNKYEMPWQFRDPGFSFMAGIKVTF